jgi:hypothetical protein
MLLSEQSQGLGDGRDQICGVLSLYNPRSSPLLPPNSHPGHDDDGGRSRSAEPNTISTNAKTAPLPDWVGMKAGQAA